MSSCEQIIEAQPTISATAKTELEASCEQAVGSNPSGFLKGDEEICVKLVDDTTPPGPVREQALAGCEKVK